MSPNAIIDAHPHLTLAAIHAALAYYYDHIAVIRSEWDDARALIAELQGLFPTRAG